MGRVQNRVAIVTGAGNGLGKAIALRLAEEGALVVCGDVDEAALDRTVGTITSGGGTALGVVGDLTQAGRPRRSSTRPSTASAGSRSWSTTSAAAGRAASGSFPRRPGTRC